MGEGLGGEESHEKTMDQMGRGLEATRNLARGFYLIVFDYLATGECNAKPIRRQWAFFFFFSFFFFFCVERGMMGAVYTHGARGRVTWTNPTGLSGGGAHMLLDARIGIGE